MIIEVRVLPKSSRVSLSWANPEKTLLKLTLTAPPVDGKANESAIKALAHFLGLKKSQINLISGHTARQKRFEILADEKAIQEKFQILD